MFVLYLISVKFDLSGDSVISDVTTDAVHKTVLVYEYIIATVQGIVYSEKCFNDF